MDRLAMLSFLALVPLLAIGILLVGLRWPARWAMPVGYVIVAAIAITVWGMDVVHVAAASVQGVIIAGSLLYIVFGALLLLATLTTSGAIASIRTAFTDIGPDRRVQAINALAVLATYAIHSWSTAKWLAPSASPESRPSRTG